VSIISGWLPDARLATLASAAADRGQVRAAAILVSVAAAVTACLLPFADLRWTGLPGFVLINQTALLVTYGLAAWVLFAQFRRGRSLPLLLAAAGTLYTAAIVVLQLASFPGVIADGRLLGSGSATTTWLWTFWHLGPPLVGLAYAAARSRPQPPVAPERTGRASALAAVVALALAGASAAVATLGLPWLPHQVTGDDYGALTTSGVGPAVQILTLAALVAVWRTTRTGRTVLELWLAAGLALLVLDNFLTMAGGTRASLGWYAGRVEALVSAFVILWAYLHEVDALRARAEAAAEEVARAEAALRQAQKMEAVGRLTGGIAHDFNNLLMVVSSGLDMIRRRPADTARVTKIAETGLEAVQRGARLTRQLLTFARRGDLRPETVNPNALLLGFEPLLRRAVAETVRLDVDLDPGAQPARLDAGEFEAALLNLVVNARDALPPAGGRISVVTRNAEIPTSGPAPAGPGVIRSEVLPPGGYVVVSVSDTGVGMDEGTLARALEPFFTTKEFGKGSGLGLAQVWGFARAAGGAVEIASAPSRGTTVSLWLPWATASASAMPASPAPPRSAASALRRADAGEVVLAVEDEPAVLAAAVETLTDLGYAVISARDATEAMEQLRGGERVDVLFSDVVMPGGMNGVQLAVEARRLRPGLRVVLTSGYTNEALGNGPGVPPDVPLLPKPYRREDLARLLGVAVA
jgi:signal transduction histidine kinase/CheY-like chemotaxis protein